MKLDSIKLLKLAEITSFDNFKEGSKSNNLKL